MNKKLSILSLGLLVASMGVFAGQADEAALQSKVDAKVQQFQDKGLLLTHDEIETLTGDLVAREVANSALSVDQAVEKYGLSPYIERYIRIKETSRRMAREGSGNGQNSEEPPTP